MEPHRKEYFDFIHEKFLITDRVNNPEIARVYLPKKGGFIRPITYIGFEALLIYQAISNYVLDFDIASFYDSIDHINPGSGSGIPQGPIASTIISEIFLDYYIDQYFSKQMRKNEIVYIRYADDIRVFSQDKAIAKKFVTLLDLLCRNSGLIPQSLKVDINFYENSRELVDQDIKKFSQIQKKYKKTGKFGILHIIPKVVYTFFENIRFKRTSIVKK